MLATVAVKSFDSPDETRPFEGMGHADVVDLAPFAPDRFARLPAVAG